MTVAMHGLWNALVAGAAITGLLTSGGGGEDMVHWMGALGVALIGLVLLALVVAQFVLLIYLSRRLARSLPDWACSPS